MGSSSRRSNTSPSWLLLVAMTLAVTLFVSGPGYCSAASAAADEQSSQFSSATSNNLSKEEPQLSATAGLVKRSAPAHSSSYGHSIMRFGRAPHNIMHFGKRGGAGVAYGDSLDGSDDGSLDASSAEVMNTVPEWILANYLAAAKQGAGQQQAASSSGIGSGKLVTKYLLVPVTVRDNSLSSYYPSAARALGASVGGSSLTKKAQRGFSEDSDNVFMHFG